MHMRAPPTYYNQRIRVTAVRGSMIRSLPSWNCIYLYVLNFLDSEISPYIKIMSEHITFQNLMVLFCLYVLYLVALGSYRLYLDPIAKFPGPKLAALTLWYEFYYDVVKRGQYTFEIDKIHKRYGQPNRSPSSINAESMYFKARS